MRALFLYCEALVNAHVSQYLVGAVWKSGERKLQMLPDGRTSVNSWIIAPVRSFFTAPIPVNQLLLVLENNKNIVLEKNYKNKHW